MMATWFSSSSSSVFHFNPLFPCSQIVLMGTPVLREDNVLRSSNVAMFQEHPCAQEPCHNGGQCNPQLDTYECVCLSGFSGGHCQSSESPVFLSFDILIWKFHFYSPFLKKKIAVTLALFRIVIGLTLKLSMVVFFWLHLKLSMSGTEICNILCNTTCSWLASVAELQLLHSPCRHGKNAKNQTCHASFMPFLCRFQTEATGMKIIKCVCRILMKFS